MRAVTGILPFLLSCTGALHSLDLLPVETTDAPRLITTEHFRLEFSPKAWTQYATQYRVGLGPDCQQLGEWMAIESPSQIVLDDKATSLSFELKSSSSRLSECRTIPLVRGDFVTLERPYDAGKVWGTWVVPESDAGNTTTLCHVGVAIGRDACVHAGEIFQTEIPGITSCTGVSARDSLDAFDWRCDEQSGGIRISTNRTKIDRGLGHLISDLKFTDNFLFVEGPNWGRRSPQKLTWENSLVPVPTTGGSAAIDLSSQNTIYVAENPVVVPGYRILNENISLVALPGASISATPSGSDNCNGNTGPNGGPNLRCMVTSDSRYFWIEGAFGFANTDNGFVFAPNADFGVVKNLRFLSSPAQHGTYFWGSVLRGENLEAVFSTPQAQGWGFIFSGGSYNVIEKVRANNVLNASLSLTCQFCWVHDVQIANSRDTTTNASGLQISQSNVLRASRIRITNPRNLGIRVLLSSQITLQDIVVVGATQESISVQGTEFVGESQTVRIQNAHLSNGSGSGVKVDRSRAVLLQNVGLFNNAQSGLSLREEARMVTTLQGASVGNGRALEWDVGVDIQRPVMLTGDLVVGQVDTCLTGPNSDSGFDSSCNTLSPSTASVYRQDLSIDPWISKINNRDTLNQSSAQSNSGVVTLSGSVDWFSFANPFRFLFRNTTNLFQFSARGAITGSTEAIWDVSLKSNSWLKRRVTPSSNICQATLNETATFDNFISGFNTPIAGLLNATELLDDGIGNDNGLCEAQESCLYTPNIGPYQGHGDLVEMCSNPGPDATWEGTKIWAYPVNGL